MMKFQYCSDLHLEFPENKSWLALHPIVPSADVLLLAGDIMPLNKFNTQNDFLDFVADNYEAVYWVPGNHEYYGFDLEMKPSTFCEQLRSNVFLVNNHVIRTNHANLILSTLWSRISPLNEWAIQRSMADFEVIKYKGKRLMPYKFTELHEECLSFLENAIAETVGQPSIIVTHHVPTLFNYPRQYLNSPINEAFVVELHELIEKSDVNYWIYGHHHFNIPEFKIGNTSLITNQLGYVMYQEHTTFNYQAFIDV